MQFKSLIFLASTVAAVLGATTANVVTDINTITSRVITLDTAIKAFTGNGVTLAAALAIHTDTTNVQSAIDAGTSDAKTVATPISEADGTSILNGSLALEPNIETALSDLVAKKASFQSLPVGGIPALIRQDLANLNASSVAFENSLLAITPADLVASGIALSTRINAAFSAAILAFADA